jgi:putative phosphoribosyl transferase
MIFRNRVQAGLILAAKLKKHASIPGVVLAVPRGGVPVAYAVARELGFPLDIILIKNRAPSE